MFIDFHQDDVATLEALQVDTLTPVPVHPGALRRLLRLGYIAAVRERTRSWVVTAAGRLALRKFYLALRRGEITLPGLSPVLV